MASPSVVARSNSSPATPSTTNATSFTPLSGVTVVPGEQLLFICTSDGNPTLSVGGGSSAGWQKLDQASDATVAVTGAVFVMLPDDNKAATASLVINSTASEQYSGTFFRIRGADSIDFGAAAQGSSTNSDPPSNSLPVSARDILAIATRSGDSTVVATVAPSGYSNLQTQAGGGTNGASTNTAERALSSVTSENPGVFTSATEQWVSYTVLLYQSDAVANGHVIANNANTTVTYRGGSVYEAEKTAGVNGSYDAGAVSSVGISGNFVLRLRPLIYTNDFHVGMNVDPLTDNNYASIDRAFAFGSLTSVSLWESGVQVLTGLTINTFVWQWRNGSTLVYGTGPDLATAQASPWRTVTDSNTLKFDSALSGVGSRFEALLYETTPAAAVADMTATPTFGSPTVGARSPVTPADMTATPTFGAATVAARSVATPDDMTVQSSWSSPLVTASGAGPQWGGALSISMSIRVC